MLGHQTERKNEMNICDKCETVSHCSKHGCIPLSECINSGQVSAAQVVAHAEDGELSMSMFASREDFDKAVAQLPIGRIVTYNAGGSGERNEIERFDKPGYSLAHSLPDGALLYSAAALAAERAEVARLRAVILQGARIAEQLKRECGMDPESPIAIQNSRYMGLSYFLRAALNPNQGETE